MSEIGKGLVFQPHRFHSATGVDIDMMRYVRTSVGEFMRDIGRDDDNLTSRRVDGFITHDKGQTPAVDDEYLLVWVFV
jgi:hypothetical protein